MPQTLAILLPFLQFLVAGGSGALASWLFTALRNRYPLPAEPPTSALAVIGYWWLYVPLGALLSNFIAAGLISLGAAVLLALATQGDVLSAADAVIAALVAALLNQVVYRWLGAGAK